MLCINFVVIGQNNAGLHPIRDAWWVYISKGRLVTKEECGKTLTMVAIIMRNYEWRSRVLPHHANV